jgi:Ser/Thr protein kinase RdoA (MazF antagonist)
MDPQNDRSGQVYEALRIALKEYALAEDVEIERINQSENITFRVDEADGERFILRVHRPGYRTREEIESELMWLDALRAHGTVEVPETVPAIDGGLVKEVAEPSTGRSRYIVLFRRMPGEHPAEDGELGGEFEALGEVTGKLHEHVRGWTLPSGFIRPTWNFDTSLGATPFWGSWRDGVGLDDEGLALFERAVSVIQRRLAVFGTAPHRFGLVHADLRLANLLCTPEKTKVIDFDDCGFSWFLYDLATAVSFIEHRPDLDDLVEHWTAGYERVAPIEPAARVEVLTLIVLRRILLVAWVGSHQEADIAGDLGAPYTQGSYPLLDRYLTEYA